MVSATILAGGYTVGRLTAALAIAGGVVALVALQPDLSSAVVLVAIAVLMLILARVPAAPLMPLFALGIAALPIVVLFLRPYQLERIQRSSPATPIRRVGLGIDAGRHRGRQRWPVGPGARPGLRPEGGILPEAEHDLAFASVVYGGGCSPVSPSSRPACDHVAGRAPPRAAPGPGRPRSWPRNRRTVRIHACCPSGEPVGAPQTGCRPDVHYGGTVAVVGFVAIGLVLAVRRDGCRPPAVGAAVDSPRSAPGRHGRLARGHRAPSWPCLSSRGSAEWQGPSCARQRHPDDPVHPIARASAARSSTATGCRWRPTVRVLHIGVSRMFDEDDSGERIMLAGLLGEARRRAGGNVERPRRRRDACRRRPGAPGAGAADHRREAARGARRALRKAALPVRTLARSVLGYVGVGDPQDGNRWPQLALGSRVGRAGLEKQYDALLRGTTVGSWSMSTPPATWSSRRARRSGAGHDLRLHLDHRPQTLATDALAQAVRSSGGDLGAAVVMDARTGGVLALASVPGTTTPSTVLPSTRRAGRPDRGGGARQDAQPRYQTAAPPASTFKIVVASANQEDRSWTRRGDRDRCRLQLRRAHVRELATDGTEQTVWRDPVVGQRVLLQSSGNSSFPNGWRGPRPSSVWAADPAIDLPGESAGSSAPRRTSPTSGTWYPGSTLVMGIGQGTVIATPVQWRVDVRHRDRRARHPATRRRRRHRRRRPDSYGRAAAPSLRRQARPVRSGMRASATAVPRASWPRCRGTAGAKTGTAEIRRAGGSTPVLRGGALRIPRDRRDRTVSRRLVRSATSVPWVKAHPRALPRGAVRAPRLRHRRRNPAGDQPL